MNGAQSPARQSNEMKTIHLFIIQLVLHYTMPFKAGQAKVNEDGVLAWQ